jgi:3-hydroxyisobutyrate dehydrogenase-like beta-hydroxyacid dehydrogenase
VLRITSTCNLHGVGSGLSVPPRVAIERAHVAKVGFVGVGQMGRPMVERLLAAGHDVTVYARRDDVRSALADLGASIVDSPREAAAAGDLVIACLFFDVQLLEVCEGPAGLLKGLHEGSILASHVTGSLSTLHQLATLASSTGAAVLDAPVSGTADNIRAGRLTVLLGGPPALVERCTEVFSAYASTVFPTGAVGSALSVKLVNNLMFTAHIQLAAAAIDLGQQFGIGQHLLLSAITTCSGASYATNTLNGVHDLDKFTEIAGPFLRKDVAACRQELVASGAQADLLLDVVSRGPLPLI